ncbi:MAG TPA: SDR family oxidoreductase [Polyangiaceae bacterium]|jgi:NAD(P)-dependent dehydrogenase (short-subunit alcohol dehydrogenase family)|nr:SDR family oxidoreductase [Polyangiaceae bacterium]
MSKAFEGKVVLVTGANSGIGESAAVAYQAAGAKVFGLARRTAAVEAARRKYPQIHWLLADVAKESDVNAAVDALLKEAGRLDVLVNNAGIGTFTPLADSTADVVRAQFEVNVYGPTFVTRAALPALKASKGSVINVGSAAGHKTMPNGAHYAATKAALESLTKSWAMELAPFGIRVNLIAPGPTDTAVFGKLGVPAEAIDAVKAQFVKMVPLGRIASPEEIARWILQLTDPSVTWVTGQILSIDGGMSL